MIPSLKSKKLAEAGIDQWKVQNKAVKALMEKYVWFEAMTVTLGKVRVSRRFLSFSMWCQKQS